MKAKYFSFALALVCFSTPALSQEPNLKWLVVKKSWSPTDEKNYSNFVAALGESGCKTVNGCLKSSANPYRASDPANINLTADCGRFSSLLRAYFAWKNNLPFSYVNDIAVVGESRDPRYSPNGNEPTSRKDILGSDNAVVTINRMISDIYTAMYRFDPRLDVNPQTNLFTDYYSVAIDGDSIRPGTMIYDPNGHVAVVYKVEDDGRVRFFDAHPDHTVSHGVYGEKFVRARPGMGAGFKNWRPIFVQGNKVVGLENKKIPDYSLEQYFGNKPSADGKWNKGEFVLANTNTPLEYYDYVRTRLAKGELKYKPIEEMSNMMDALCQDIQDRQVAVSTALATGVQRKSHPVNLPENIYGTGGEWEASSSPSRDARLKTSFLELRKNVERFVSLYQNRDPRIEYSGTDLAGDLKAAYAATAAKCNVSYVKTDGTSATLNYNDIVKRLFELSFDPYHCVELRWGASGNELQSCQDNQNKLDWYNAEQGLRNQLERRYDVKMGFTLEQLTSGVPGSGVKSAPDVDLKSYLDTLR